MSSLLGRPQRAGADRVKLPHPAGAVALLVAYVLALGAAIYGFYADGMLRKSLPFIDVAAGLAAVVLLYLLRRAVQAVSAARPGVIQITVVSPKSGQRALAKQLVARLHEELAKVKLSGPSVVPGESPPQGFLSDVRAAVQGVGGSWAALGAVLSVLSRGAYHVACIVQEEAESDRKSLTVEVSGYPWRDISVATVGGDTWDEVTKGAAYNVAAYVLPRTRLFRRPPWTPWHGINLSPDLFTHFHQARTLASERRLEEALHCFDQAIERDPLNPYIRIEKATVLDQLGLWVDALGTYVDVITIESWYDQPVWKRYRRIFHDIVQGVPSVTSRSPNGRAALQVARYRMICSLAAGQRLAEQWHRNVTNLDKRRGSTGGPPLRRLDEANRVISRLRPLLDSYAHLMMDGHGVPRKSNNPGRAEDGQREKALTMLHDDKKAMLRRVFQFAAVEESAAMVRDYRWYRMRRRSRLPISQSAIRVLPMWAALQYHYVEYVQQKSKTLVCELRKSLLKYSWAKRPIRWWRWRSGNYGIRWLKRADRIVGWQAPGDAPSASDCKPASKGQWPPDPDGVARMLRRAIRGRLGRNNGWQDHYNAACTFAVCMLTPESHRVVERLKPEDKGIYRRDRRLVQLSVHELSGAVVAADSQFAAGQSVWLRRGDQDLDDLRVTPYYTTFINRYLPAPNRAEDFPNPTLVAVSRHVARLLQQYAALRHSFWREQGAKPAISSFEDEHTWWRRLHEYCHNYRDWGTRWDAIMLASSLTGGTMSFDPAMPDSGPDVYPDPANKPIHPDPGKKPHAASDEDRVRAWLNKSDELKLAAKERIRSRNEKLEKLNEKLTEAEVEKALKGSVRVLSSSSARRALSAQLTATWDAISKYIDDSDNNHRACELAAEIDRLRYMLFSLRFGER